MARPASKHPTELELAMLKIIWTENPLSVRQVRDALAPTRKLAYTSVMTIMNIMVRKGYLKRKKKGAGYLYQPRITRKATTRRMLRDLVDRVFDGSAASVILNLLESAELDEAEIVKLRGLLKRRAREDRK